MGEPARAWADSLVVSPGAMADDSLAVLYT